MRSVETSTAQLILIEFVGITELKMDLCQWLAFGLGTFKKNCGENDWVKRNFTFLCFDFYSDFYSQGERSAGKKYYIYFSHKNWVHLNKYVMTRFIFY